MKKSLYNSGGLPVLAPHEQLNPKLLSIEILECNLHTVASVHIRSFKCLVVATNLCLGSWGCFFSIWNFGCRSLQAEKFDAKHFHPNFLIMWWKMTHTHTYVFRNTKYKLRAEVPKSFGWELSWGPAENLIGAQKKRTHNS